MTLTEQTDAEFLRRIVTDFKEQMVGVAQRRILAIADRLEAERPTMDDWADGTEQIMRWTGSQPGTEPSLPDLLTECLGCKGTRPLGHLACGGTGKVLTPAGQQVSELIDWKST